MLIDNINKENNIIELNGMTFKAFPVCFLLKKRSSQVSDMLSESDFLFGKLTPIAGQYDVLDSLVFNIVLRGSTIITVPRDTNFNYLFDSFYSGGKDFYFEGLKLRLLSDFDDSYSFEGGFSKDS